VYAIGQFRLGLRMAEIVAHVREVGLLRPDRPGGLDGALHAHMGRVGMVTQGVDYEQLDAARCFDCLGGHGIAVGKVGELPTPIMGENVARGGKSPMWKLGRRNLEIAQGERPGDLLREGPHIVAERGPSGGKGKREDSFQILDDLRGGMNRHFLVLRLAVSTQIVEAHDVIRMGMGIEHGIDAPDILTQDLGPKIRRRVDDDLGMGRANAHRCTEAGVPRVA